jgi:DNA-binding IclR family transcriptional regulator
LARSAAGESVVARVARVLRAFDQDHTALTAAEIARRAALPVPTAHRIVAQLVAEGLLERGDDHQVRIGSRLWALGLCGTPALQLREAAMPYLEDAHAVTRQHIWLYALDGLDVLVIERLRARNAVANMRLKVGKRVPANATAGGTVLFAHAAAELQDAMLALPQRVYGQRTPATPGQIRARWRAALRDGYAIGEGWVEPHVTGVAVPVRGPGGNVAAALGVLIPSAGTRPEAQLPVLLAASRGITRALQPRRAVPRPAS